jgi:hypothetical protein
MFRHSLHEEVEKRLPVLLLYDSVLLPVGHQLLQAFGAELALRVHIHHNTLHAP